MKDKNGNDSFVIAGVWRNETIESDDVNQIKSVYPLDDFIAQIKKSAETGKLVVINKNKAEEMLKTIGIQSAEVSRILNLAKSRLSQDAKDVNSQFSFSLDDVYWQREKERLEAESRKDEEGYWQSLNRARFERDSAQFQRTQEEVVQENENEADWESRLEEDTTPQSFASQNPAPLTRGALNAAVRIHKTAL